jgi:hypothetical protein
MRLPLGGRFLNSSLPEKVYAFGDNRTVKVKGRSFPDKSDSITCTRTLAHRWCQCESMEDQRSCCLMKCGYLSLIGRVNHSDSTA